MFSNIVAFSKNPNFQGSLISEVIFSSVSSSINWTKSLFSIFYFQGGTHLKISSVIKPPLQIIVTISDHKFSEYPNFTGGLISEVIFSSVSSSINWTKSLFSIFYFQGGTHLKISSVIKPPLQIIVTISDHKFFWKLCNFFAHRILPPIVKLLI